MLTLEYEVVCNHATDANVFAHLATGMYKQARAEIVGFNVVVLTVPFVDAEAALMFERYATNLLLAHDYASAKRTARAALDFVQKLKEATDNG